MKKIFMLIMFSAFSSYLTLPSMNQQELRKRKQGKSSASQTIFVSATPTINTFNTTNTNCNSNVFNPSNNNKQRQRSSHKPKSASKHGGCCMGLLDCCPTSDKNS